MKKRTKTDTSKPNRRSIANEIAEQIGAWMDIRQDHFLAEQEIGHLSSLMLCLRMGEAGRVRWVEIAKSDQYGSYLVDAAMHLVQAPNNDNRPDLKAMVALGKDLEKRRREYLKAMDALCDAVEAAEPLHAEVSRRLGAED